MPTIQATSRRDEAVTVPCPLCKAPLHAKHRDACAKCDWVVKPVPHAITHPGTFRDRAAVALSVVPGLGHMYKGYKVMGAICAVGAVFAFLACTVVATFAAGFGMLLLPVYWVGIMLHVYWLEDRGITPPSEAK
jgi:hypothetical protein